ncbi:hypothetical protein MKX03_007392, partial [Papaver bracteatum]
MVVCKDLNDQNDLICEREKVTVTYEKEVQAFRLRNSELLALVEEKTSECAGLQEKLNELSLRKDIVERKNEELEVEKNRLGKELNDNLLVCKDLEDQNSLVCEREKVAVTYEKELEAFRLSNSELLALVEEKTRKYVGFEEELNDLSSRKDVVERMNGVLEIEKNRLGKELIENMIVCKDLKDQNSLISGREK